MARAGGFFAPPARQEQPVPQQPQYQSQGAPAAAAAGGGVFLGPPATTGGGGFIGNNNADQPDGCERCGDPRPHAISPKWLAAFGIALCTVCRAADELVTKSAAKEAYLVTDADLAPLGTLSRENPRHRQFAPMKLYLASQVAAVAARKHGGAEGLQAARAARVGAKLEARAAKRRREQAQEAAERERRRLEREAAARLAEMEAEEEDEEVIEIKEEEEEEDGDGGGEKKKLKASSSKDGGGSSKGRGRRGGGSGGGRSEVVVDEATGKRGRRFGEGLAVVDEAEVEEI